MIFLANENFPMPSVKLLRLHGYQVISIQEKLGGISDEEVLEKAINEGLIILTFDRDYGELIFKYRKSTPPAVVYFRIKGESPKDAAEVLIKIIENSNIEIHEAFTVIDDTNIRQRKLPN
jgi:predicted nuclease of predicted toxin-antitoxin system